MSASGVATPSHDAKALARWRNAVITAFALGGVSLATWGPRLPSLRSDLGLSYESLGLLVAAVTVGSIAGLVSASALLAWLGPRGGIWLTLTIDAVGIAVIGLSAGVLHSAPAATIGFILVGFGIGAVDVMMNVQGAAVEHLAGKTLMPLMHAAWSAGAVLGSAIGAASAALGVSVGTQLVVESVLIAAVAAVSVQFIPRTDGAASAEAKPPVRARIRSWLSGWADVRLLMIGLVMLGVELGEGSANNWLTLSVRDDHHQTDAIAALFFTAFALGETLARVFGGPLVDRVGRVRTVRFTTALGVIGVLLFILGGAPWLVLIGVILWAVGVSMGFPLGMSAAADSGPNPAARVSVVASIGYLANLGGPPVVGFLAQQFGLLNSLWLIIVLLAVSFAAAGALRPRSKTNA
ncbi:MFS transporter [Rathayibacter soli]|uniref:MFS transporter n=1 Tax=Rathayibacter soli TaxID=3144168 RepID=UPI0027E59501|nr:MFS transporter [Glaciibacter superstes]